VGKKDIMRKWCRPAACAMVSGEVGTTGFVVGCPMAGRGKNKGGRTQRANGSGPDRVKKGQDKGKEAWRRGAEGWGGRQGGGKTANARKS